MRIETLSHMLTPKEFQSHRIKMLDFYFSTEADFLDILRVIPIENHPSTFSPKLYNILQSACSQVENLLRLLCDKFDLPYSKNPDSIYKEYSDLVNKNGALANQRIAMVTVTDGLSNTIYPFQTEPDKDKPIWWEQYNMTKHYLPNGLKKGNLGNTLNALAGVYVLHGMAYHAQYAVKDFFEKSHWIPSPISWTGDGELIEYMANQVPESDLFYYAMLYNEAGASIG